MLGGPKRGEIEIMHPRALLGLALWGCLTVVTPTAAQITLDKATLGGTIRDATGGVLPGVTVSVTSAATGSVRTSVTDQSGVYRTAALPPAVYEVRVERGGFATKVFADVALTVGQYAELDVVLDLAPTATTIVVDGTAKLVEPTRVAQASTLSQTEIEGLPINQRSFLDFALLTPGATAANPLSTPTPTNSPTSGLSFAGQDQRSNDVTIDGADNMDAAVNSVRSTLSQDAVQEFQVLRSTFSAEFGRARGGVVNIVSKSGTQVLRGGGFLFFRDDKLDSRNAFAFGPSGAAVDSPFRRYQYGATLGGPLVRDRLFFFASVEDLRRRESTFVSVLQGDRLLRQTPSQQRLFDALGTSGSPQLVAMAAALAHPTSGLLNTTRATFPGTLDLLQRESGTFPFESDSHTASLRLDEELSGGSQLTGRINFNDATARGNDVGGLRGVSSGTRNATRNVAAVVSNTQVMSEKTVNIVRAQYSRFHTAILPTDPSGPGVIIGGVAQIGRDLFNPTDYAWNIFQASDTLLRSRGRHELKFGADVLHMRSADATAEIFLAGQFQFAEAIPLAAVLDSVFGSGATAGVGARLATPVGAGGLGRPDLLPDLLAPISALQSYNFGLPVVYLQGFGDPTTDIIYTQAAGFAQDEIRIGSRATISAGLRYDTDWRDPSVNVSNATAPFALVRSVITDRNNLAPRLGLAYALGQQRQTVLRGGWGLFYQNAPTVGGFISRVLSGQIAQVFLPLTGLPGINGTSADVWQRYKRDGRVDGNTLKELGISPGTTPAVLFTAKEHTPNAVSSQASAGLEYEVTPDLAISVEYTHNRGRNIIRSRDINVRRVGTDSFALPGLDPRFLQLNVLEASGRSAYHGLSLSLRKRYSNRWALSGSYTMAHAMDDVTDFTLENEADDQTNLTAEWGPSAYDQRHRLVASAVFQAPAGTATPAWMSNWSIGSIVTFASGRPFNPLVGYDANGDSHPDTDRARLTSGGPVGRNSGVGPVFFTVDARVARQIEAGGRTRIDFLAEVFNLFNRTNYSGVNRVFGSQGLQAGNIRGSREVAPTEPGGFTSAFASRQVQLGVRLKF
jgi:hypothetical protein